MKNRQYLEDLSKGNCIPLVNVINLGGRGGGSDRKSSCLTDVTYSQLVALIGANGLLAGCNYRITDFRTRELIPNTTDIIVGSIEPLIVQATTTNSIDNTNVLSTVYPQDRIYYEVINSTTSADDRGRIYYREETILDVIAGYNWRVIKFRRWESIVEPGKFIVLTNNGGAFQDFYTFNNSPTAGNCNATHIGMITDSIIPFALSMGIDVSDKLNNFIIGSLAPDVFTVDNNFADDCFYNTIICLGDGTILSNRASALFAGFPPISGEFTGNSYYDGKTFLNNIFNSFYANNRMKQDFNANEFNTFCIGNTFETGYNGNIAGNNFQNNIVDELCNSNIFGNQCLANVIGKRFGFDITNTPHGNVLGDNFSGNIIGDRCTSNNIGNDCTGNIFGNDSVNNVILHDFQNNKTSGNFQLNTIETGLNGKDFTAGATRVYQSYTKEIVKTTSAGPVPPVYVLRYTDSTPPFGALVYDNIFS